MAQAGRIEELEAKVGRDPGCPEFAALAELYRRAGRFDEARRVAVAGLAERPDDTAGRLALGLALLDLGEAAAARYELERAMGHAAVGLVDAVPSAPDGDATWGGGLPGSAWHTDAPSDALDAPPAGARVDSLPDIDRAAAAAARDLASDAAIDEDELEAAFADAESVRDEMVDANQLAAQAMVASQLDEPEGFPLEDVEALSGVELDAFQMDEASVAPRFATETMARLLARQGDAAGADQIRRRMARGEPPAASVAVVDAAVAPDAVVDSFASSHASDPAAAHRARVVATLERWLENLQRVHA